MDRLEHPTTVLFDLSPLLFNCRDDNASVIVNYLKTTSSEPFNPEIDKPCHDLCTNTGQVYQLSSGLKLKIYYTFSLSSTKIFQGDHESEYFCPSATFIVPLSAELVNKIPNANMCGWWVNRPTKFTLISEDWDNTLYKYVQNGLTAFDAIFIFLQLLFIDMPIEYSADQILINSKKNIALSIDTVIIEPSKHFDPFKYSYGRPNKSATVYAVGIAMNNLIPYITMCSNTKINDQFKLLITAVQMLSWYHSINPDKFTEWELEVPEQPVKLDKQTCLNILSWVLWAFDYDTSTEENFIKSKVLECELPYAKNYVDQLSIEEWHQQKNKVDEMLYYQDEFVKRLIGDADELLEDFISDSDSES